MPITDIAALVAICAAMGGAAWESVRIMRRLERKFSEFQTDWAGTPGRPGVPRRAGVMERLEVIEHELTLNSGSSVKDAVTRIDQAISRRGI